MVADIIAFGFPRPHAEELIHRLALQGRFVLEPVCKTKMRIRDFSMRQVLETMKEGIINQGPRLDECGDWRCRLRKRHAGRLVRVIVAIHNMDFLYVISVH
jgi:hypothetical protein